jgi:hypothetical protein
MGEELGDFFIPFCSFLNDFNVAAPVLFVSMTRLELNYLINVQANSFVRINLELIDDFLFEKKFFDSETFLLLSREMFYCQSLGNSISNFCMLLLFV